MELYRVGVSPHIRHEDTTRSLMLDVSIALLPAALWGIYVFGLRALVILLTALFFCLFFDFIFRRGFQNQGSVKDASAVVSGMLLALFLPVSVPLWIVPLGAFFAMLVKQLFGGLGKNFLNPVLSAKAFLLLSFPLIMTRFTLPFSYLSPFTLRLSDSAVKSALISSPLQKLQQGEEVAFSLSELFSGTIPGCIGEISALLLLAGMVYLLVRHVISFHIPLTFVGTAALLFFLFPKGDNALLYMTQSLLSGSLFLGAIFMATDPVTSPVTTGGKLLFGFLCGALTFLLRRFSTAEEAVVFAILTAELFVPYLDRIFRPRPYGIQKRKKEVAV